MPWYRQAVTRAISTCSMPSSNRQAARHLSNLTRRYWHAEGEREGKFELLLRFLSLFARNWFIASLTTTIFRFANRASFSRVISFVIWFHVSLFGFLFIFISGTVVNEFKGKVPERRHAWEERGERFDALFFYVLSFFFYILYSFSILYILCFFFIGNVKRTFFFTFWYGFLTRWNVERILNAA